MTPGATGYVRPSPEAMASATARLESSVSDSRSGLFRDSALTSPQVPVPPIPMHPPALLQTEYLRAYLTLDEYLRTISRLRNLELPTGFWREYLLAQHSRNQMLIALATLNAAIAAGLSREVLNSLRSWAVPDVLTALDTVPDISQRAPIVPQGVLLGMAEVLRANHSGSSVPSMPPITAAILLAQAMLDETSDPPATEAGESVAVFGMPMALAQETVMNFAFHASDDPPSQFERASRLWLGHPPRPRAPLRSPPAELFQEAAGVKIATATDIGMCLWATLRNLPQFHPPFVPTWNDFPFPAATLDRCPRCERWSLRAAPMQLLSPWRRATAQVSAAEP